MTTSEAIIRLRLLVSSRHNLIAHTKRKKILRPSEKAMTITMYENDIKAIELAIRTLKDMK